MKINLQQPHTIQSLRPSASTAEQRVAEAEEVRDAFRTCVGEAFFGQMLKSMRRTQGKPAYFHGGRAEEMFRSQLDQTMAQQMTVASADKIADPMFRQQFPAQAEILRSAEKTTAPSLDDLQQLGRR